MFLSSQQMLYREEIEILSRGQPSQREMSRIHRLKKELKGIQDVSMRISGRMEGEAPSPTEPEPPELTIRIHKVQNIAPFTIFCMKCLNVECRCLLQSQLLHVG